MGTSGRAGRLTLLLALLAAAVAPALACRKTPARDEQVTILLTSDVLSLDPNRDVEAVTDSVLWNAYEALVTFDADLKVKPLLAASWEHPEPERWRFRLRPGVRFHDGTVLDADAVKAAFDGLRAQPEQEAGSFVHQIASVAATAPDVVEITTHEPRALLAQLPFLYVTRTNPAGGSAPLLGTGPYRVTEWTAGQRVVLDRWDGYWGARPAFGRAVFVPVPDASRRLQQLLAGADLAYGIAPDVLGQHHDGVRFLRRSGLTVYYIGLDVRPGPGNPLADARVRRALHLALDRTRLVREVLKGAGAVPTQLVSPLVFGYDPGQPRPVLDRDTARALLADAGYPSGFRVRFDVPKQRSEMAWRVQEDLRAIGVELELNPLEGDEVYALAERGQSRMFYAGWNCTTGEASEFYEFNLHSPDSRHGSGNYGGYTDKELDHIAETNASVLDMKKRREQLQRAAAIAMRDLPLLPLVVEDDVYGVREGLVFEPRADGEVRLLELAPAP
jgi:peptide/nickel transport system substrate-binding protein